MITESDSFTTIDLGAYYAILPSDLRLYQRYKEAGISFLDVPQGFAFNSGTNPDFLNVEQLRSLIRQHVNSAFVPLRKIIEKRLSSMGDKQSPRVISLQW